LSQQSNANIFVENLQNAVSRMFELNHNYLQHFYLLFNNEESNELKSHSYIKTSPAKNVAKNTAEIFGS